MSLTIRSASNFAYVFGDPTFAELPLYFSESAVKHGTKPSYAPSVSMEPVGGNADLVRLPVLSQRSVWVYPPDANLHNSYTWNFKLSEYAKKILKRNPRGKFKIDLLGYRVRGAGEERLVLEPVDLTIEFYLRQGDQER